MLQSNITTAKQQIDELADRIKRGEITCFKKDVQNDGDIRYWNVEAHQHPLLETFKTRGEELYASELGHRPQYSFIMINDIEASRSPTGSGGGWHLDSFQSQYKFFLYMSDVESDEMGAFAFFPQTRAWWFRAYALAKRIFFRSVRYTQPEIDLMKRLGLSYTSVKGPKGTSFFLDTSQLHRGLPISKGRRLLATLYLYDKISDGMKTDMGLA